MNKERSLDPRFLVNSPYRKVIGFHNYFKTAYLVKIKCKDYEGRNRVYEKLSDAQDFVNGTVDFLIADSYECKKVFKGCTGYNSYMDFEDDDKLREELEKFFEIEEVGYHAEVKYNDEVVS